MLNISLPVFRVIGTPELTINSYDDGSCSIAVQDSVDDFVRANDILIFMPNVDPARLKIAVDLFNTAIKEETHDAT